MKKKSKYFCCLTFFGIIFYYSSNQLLGQEKMNISLGIGFPELLNIGARYQLKQAQLGMSLGSFPSATEGYFYVSGDMYYHFGGLSKLSLRHPWYGRIGLNYLRREDKEPYSSSKYSYSYFLLRVGRDFNISKKLGIELDWGFGLRLINTENQDIPLIPTAGLGLFYRL